MKLPEILIQLREKKQLPPAELARLLGLSLQQIRALESERFYRLPRQTLLRTLEKYERFFRLPAGELSSQLLAVPTEVSDQQLGNPVNLPRKVNYSLILILAVIAFLLYQFTLLLRPPKLILTSPRPNQITTQAELIISGYVQPRNTLTINGEVVTPNDQGYFEKRAFLREGPNDFVFEVTTYWKTKSTIKRTVYYSARGFEAIFTGAPKSTQPQNTGESTQQPTSATPTETKEQN